MSLEHLTPKAPCSPAMVTCIEAEGTGHPYGQFGNDASFLINFQIKRYKKFHISDNKKNRNLKILALLVVVSSGTFDEKGTSANDSTMCPTPHPAFPFYHLKMRKIKLFTIRQRICTTKGTINQLLTKRNCRKIL